MPGVRVGRSAIPSIPGSVRSLPISARPLCRAAESDPGRCPHQWLILCQRGPFSLLGSTSADAVAFCNFRRGGVSAYLRWCLAGASERASSGLLFLPPVRLVLWSTVSLTEGAPSTQRGCLSRGDEAAPAGSRPAAFPSARRPSACYPSSECSCRGDKQSWFSLLVLCLSVSILVARARSL